jgi:hypothetical protein
VERDGAISGGLDYRQACKAHLPGIGSDAPCCICILAIPRNEKNNWRAKTLNFMSLLICKRNSLENQG